MPISSRFPRITHTTHQLRRATVMLRQHLRQLYDYLLRHRRAQIVIASFTCTVISLMYLSILR